MNIGLKPFSRRNFFYSIGSRIEKKFQLLPKSLLPTTWLSDNVSLSNYVVVVVVEFSDQKSDFLCWVHTFQSMPRLKVNLRPLEGNVSDTLPIRNTICYRPFLLSLFSFFKDDLCVKSDVLWWVRSVYTHCNLSTVDWDWRCLFHLMACLLKWCSYEFSNEFSPFKITKSLSGIAAWHYFSGVLYE